MKKKYLLKIKDRGNVILEFEHRYGCLYIEGVGYDSLLNMLKNSLKLGTYDEIGGLIRAFGIENMRLQNGKIIAEKVKDPDAQIERFLDWLRSVDQFEIGNPTAISKKLATLLSGYEKINFSMKLDDFKATNNIEPYKHQIESNIGGTRLTNGDADNIWYLAAVESSKFNFIDVEDDMRTITFTNDKDYYSPKVDGKRQSGKLSKIIGDFIRVSSLYIKPPDTSVPDDENQFDHGNYCFYIEDPDGSSAYYGREKYMSDMTTRWGSDEAVTTKNLKKAMNRMIELYLTEIQPRTFDLKLTTDVGLVYGTENAENKAGTLGNSCMAPHNKGQYKCAEQGDFYNGIPGIQIIYALDKKGGLLGRALIWANVTSKGHDKPFTFIDRIYGAEDFVSAVKKWGYEKGYFSKIEQSCGNTTLEDKDGKKLISYKTSPSRMPKGKVNRMIPYFDTMKYFIVTSFSKRYAKLSLSTHEEANSVKMSGCEARPVILPCLHCGSLVGRNALNQAAYVNEFGVTINKAACYNCSAVYNGARYVKSKDDIKLTFKSNGERIMPLPVKNQGHLVKVNIDGKDILFDVTDKYGIQDFFTKKVVKPKKNKKRKVTKLGSVSDRNGDGTSFPYGSINRLRSEPVASMPDPVAVEAEPPINDDEAVDIGW